MLAPARYLRKNPIIMQVNNNTQKTKKTTNTWYFNPFYDDLFLTLGASVPTKRVGYKQESNGKAIITSLPKGTREFEAKMKSMLSKQPDPAWPRTGRLLVSMLVTLNKTEYKIKDVDNLAKSLLDAMKGVVFTDDVQVDTLHVVKQPSDSNAFFVGIKQLSHDSQGWYYPPLYQREKPFEKLQTYQVLAQPEQNHRTSGSSVPETRDGRLNKE